LSEPGLSEPGLSERPPPTAMAGLAPTPAGIEPAPPELPSAPPPVTPAAELTWPAPPAEGPRLPPPTSPSPAPNKSPAVPLQPKASDAPMAAARQTVLDRKRRRAVIARVGAPARRQRFEPGASAAEGAPATMEHDGEDRRRRADMVMTEPHASLAPRPSL
jgi:hypothetical protein